MEPERAAVVGRTVAVAVLVIGPLWNLFVNGTGVLGEFTFWFGLYGWMCAGIVVGSIVYALLRREQPVEA